MWKLWCKALGQKASDDDREADNVAYIRTAILFTYLITNVFICAGVLRHWNDSPNIIIEVHEAQPVIPMVNVRSNRTGEFE